ncbi:MAG: hypothetical protein ACOH2R_08600 [Pseudomonas sp.]
MLRRFRIWRAERALEEARSELFSWAHDSATIQEDALNYIVGGAVSIESRRSGDLFDTSTNIELYRLFLHQQNMGYLVESVRKKTYMLNRLRPNKITKLWEIGEDLGSTGNAIQSALFREFINNILPKLEQMESERLSHIES